MDLLMNFRGWYMITLNISNIHTQWIRVNVGSMSWKNSGHSETRPSVAVPTFLSSFISHSLPWHRLCLKASYYLWIFCAAFHTACPWYSSTSPSKSCLSVRSGSPHPTLQGVTSSIILPSCPSESRTVYSIFLHGASSHPVSPMRMSAPYDQR